MHLVIAWILTVIILHFSLPFPLKLHGTKRLDRLKKSVKKPKNPSVSDLNGKIKLATFFNSSKDGGFFRDELWNWSQNQNKLETLSVTPNK